MDWTPRLIRSLSDADCLIGQLSGEGKKLPNPHLLIRPFIKREAVLFSRCVLNWKLSNTPDAGFCIETLQRELSTGRRPEIFNTTDKGSQFTSDVFTGLLTKHGIAISMDGVGRAFDNIMVERP